MKRSIHQLVFLAVFLLVSLLPGTISAEEATNTWTINYATASSGLYREIATISYPLRSGIPPLMFIGDTASRSITYVSHDDPLPAVGTFTSTATIASVTVTVLPIFANASGNAATAAVDINHYARVNLSSISVPISVTTASNTPLFTDEYGATNGSTTTYLVGTSDVPIVTLSGRRSIVLVASGPFSLAVGSATVPAGSVPIYNFSGVLGQEVLITVKTASINTNVTAHQFGR